MTPVISLRDRRVIARAPVLEAVAMVHEEAGPHFDAVVEHVPLEAVTAAYVGGFPCPNGVLNLGFILLSRSHVVYWMFARAGGAYLWMPMSTDPIITTSAQRAVFGDARRASATAFDVWKWLHG